ncbi:esterase-like activity of phytase family protein [Brevibacillus brevis]|uniref:Esterase-like activity of phytase family protein n=1 Tax=Brevibacillus brevis TaxID=1393 RepID=A0ABY9T744_BREBE|nr:esterase-like activity of phytase family protein [Brevibacillus brevis]WNC15920.1 esterase-like activity of phytase family protein [Brevibacillus brevis]
MKKNWLIAALAALTLSTAAGIVSAEETKDGVPELTGKYKLAAPDLAKGIKMGIGSSLTHLPGDPDNIFYTTADRGPNGDVTVTGKSGKTFPLPKYTPTIYKIEIADGQIKILDQIPLKVSGIDPVTGNAFITGLPNIKGRDETPYDSKQDQELPYDPYGLDVESLSYNPKDDTFWLSEEYGPSIVHVKRDGTLIERIVPKGWAARVSTPLVPAREMLPAVYNKLRQNRGAEALSITPDGKYMFMAMQSPLRNPGKETDNSRQLRIIKFELATLQPVAEFAYITEDAKPFTNLNQSDIVISDMYAVNEHTLLIDERDKNAGDNAQLKRIYSVDLSAATNILGKYDDNKSGAKTLEQMSVDELKANGITPSSKRTIVDVAAFQFPYEKVEGLTLVGGNTIVIINDNDFGVGSTSSENGTELWTFKLPYTIK